MFRRLTYILLLLALTLPAFAGAPLMRGTWKGFLISKSMDVDNKDGLSVTLNISDDNERGDIGGEIIVRYRYQTDIYKAKWKVSGQLDYSNFTVTLQQENFVYYDLLPKGLEWCTGSGKLNLYRSNYKKKVYLDGYMTTNCGGERLRLILVKQQ